ncbi:MAG TPA: SMP-30/gluconolactonase/LRE family protein [Gaiellaceae bacterium]|nr:SMP-30/gluconolactonase/LRE family protein [Gaiellaceae bacterium]
MTSVEVCIDVRCELGEGPRWDAATGTLLFVDIERRTMFRWDGSSLETQRFDERVGCLAPTVDGDVVVGLASRVALASTGETLARFPHGPDVRANDGACDPDGRLWIGTMQLDERPGAAALYRLDGDRLVEKLGGLTISNGLGWSADRTRMWFVDTPTQRVVELAYDGELGARRTFAEVDAADGSPDGLAVDDEDCVWVALWGGSAVRRYTPDGELDRVVAVPARNPTSCAIGGTTLYVTTAAPDGRVYCVDAGVTAPPAQPFRRTAPSEAEPTSAR